MKRRTRQKTTEQTPPRIIQLSIGQWTGNNGKLNSTLYGLLTDGRVVQYIPSRVPHEAGWRKLNMRPPTPPVPQEWEVEF